MRRIRNIFLIFTLIISIVLIFQIDQIQAQDGRFRQHAKIFDSLTEEQRQAIHEKVEELRESGVSREEIHETVKEMLQDLGVEVPDNFKMGPRMGRKGRMHGLEDQLTEEQIAELRQKREELKENGASHDEIRDAMKELLESYGIESPEKGLRGERGGRFGHKGFMRDSRLTEEQKAEIKQKVDELKEQGADRQEIRNVVHEMLQNYGIERPERDGKFKRMRPHGRGMRGFLHGLDLTDEQREAIKAKIHELHEQDASREEIHETINKMLDEYGIEIPEEIKQRQEIMESLTEEQRKAVRAKVREMRKNGSSREEIHQAVQELIEEFNGAQGTQYNIDSNEIESTNKNISISNFPNPFNPETTIRYELKQAVHVNANIYNYQGQLVRQLENKYMDAGSYNLNWDGRNKAGQLAPSGIYFLRINAGSETFSHRLILTK